MAFDPFGNLMRAQIAKRTVQGQERQQALQERVALAKLAEMERQSQLAQTRRSTLSNLFQPQQSGGPLKGSSYQPVNFQQPNVSNQDIFGALMKIGDAETAAQFAPQQQGYDIKQTATGEYVYLPETPGQAVPSGVMGETGRGKTNIDLQLDKGPQIGTIPKDHKLVKDNDGSYRMEVIPGSPTSRELKQAEKAAKLNASEATNKAKLVTKQIDKALDGVGVLTSGFIGKMMSQVPGSKAYDLGQTIDTVRANIGFDALQKMRDASPTGGALGQVSERELAQLERVLGSLDQAQSPQQLADMLMQVKTHYNNWKDTVSAAEESPDAWVKDNTGPIKAGVVEDGYKFMGGDPADQNNWKKVQ